jgi:hypothetical protein
VTLKRKGESTGNTHFDPNRPVSGSACEGLGAKFHRALTRGQSEPDGHRIVFVCAITSKIDDAMRWVQKVDFYVFERSRKGRA